MFLFIFFLFLAIQVYIDQYRDNSSFEDECKSNNKEELYITIDFCSPYFYCFIIPFWIFASKYVNFAFLISIHYLLQTFFWIDCYKRYWFRDKHKKNWYVSYVIIIISSFLLFILFFCFSNVPKLINGILK